MEAEAGRKGAKVLRKLRLETLMDFVEPVRVYANYNKTCHCGISPTVAIVDSIDQEEETDECGEHIFGKGYASPDKWAGEFHIKHSKKIHNLDVKK